MIVQEFYSKGEPTNIQSFICVAIGFKLGDSQLPAENRYFDKLIAHFRDGDELPEDMQGLLSAYNVTGKTLFYVRDILLTADNSDDPVTAMLALSKMTMVEVKGVDDYLRDYKDFEDFVESAQ